MDRATYDALSNRERDCLRLVGRGYRRSEVADQLRISESTVATHVANGRLKLGGQDARVAGRAILQFEAHSLSTSPPSPIPAPLVSYDRPGTDNAAVATMVREHSEEPEWQTPTKEQLTAPNEGRRRDLSMIERVGWIVAIATGLAILGIAAFPLADSAHRTVRSVLPAATH